MDNATIVDLVTRMKTGDREAGAKLFEHFQHSTFNWCRRRLGNFQDAQDITQEVLLQAILKIDQLRDNRCFAGWLRGITHRMCINYLKRNPHRQHASLIEEICFHRPENCAEINERNQRLRDGITTLTQNDQRALREFYFDYLTHIEMSHSNECPIGTIKSRLHFARKRLARALMENDPEVFAQ